MQTESLKRSNYVETEVIRIGGTHDPLWADKLTAALRAIEGVQEVAIEQDAEKARVVFSPEQTSKELLRAAVNQTGLEALKPVHGEDGACCGGCGG